MNIFSALSEGHGRISETNLSAFLSFLLTPERAHGLSDTFLRLFLREVAERSGDFKRFDAVLNTQKILVEVGLEVRYTGKDTNRSVDVEVKLFERIGDDYIERHRIFIENKIRSNAAQTMQFKHEFENVLGDIDAETIVTAIFLTPDIDSDGLRDEFNQLELSSGLANKKVWLRWNQQQCNNDKSVICILQDLLLKEANGEIEPVSEYTRHTLKAFIQFAGRLMAPTALKSPVSSGEFELIDDLTVVIDGISYKLQSFANGAVKMFDHATGHECSAIRLLRRLNDQEGLGISQLNSSGTPKNTRRLGRDIVSELRRREKVKFEACNDAR